ncbi:MAG: phosphatase PAP2 family protein [Bacteroidetes bacterium]|nr:phosphatase PAP2 family protein [Bacteroidota bacterium]
MKQQLLTSKYWLLLLVLSFVSCEPLQQDENFAPTSIAPPTEEDAVNWKLIPGAPVSNLAQVSVPVPTATTSSDYAAELETIRGLQKNLSSEQKKIIAKWSSGGVLRWNRYMRELVARFALAPAPLLDGTYPTPDAENPFSDPVFPFSNPPYAARAYSYVSVAQYQALQVAWFYKFKYNRPAPHQVGEGIEALVPKSTLPAYPSEDAVMSAVTCDLLKVLFPTAVEEITKMAAEQRNAALWSGKASPSDLSAGLALGKSIAALFTARASGDGMRNAIGTKAQWMVLADSASVRLKKIGRDVSKEVFWKSQDSPVRPPMLPFFGKVKGWILAPSDFTNRRPGPPPSTTSNEMAKELEEVKFYSKNSTRERIAIVHFWADGLGTYTPPGHWNDIAANYIQQEGWSEIRSARAFALLNMALHNAAVGCWEAKYYYFNPRPTQLDASIKTLTGLPNFPSYPSGHSTFSASAAKVLTYLFPEGTEQFKAWRDEASISRLYGAIHYRIDTKAGVEHGSLLADPLIDFAAADGADN